MEGSLSRQQVLSALGLQYSDVKAVRKGNSEFIEVNRMVLLSLLEAEQVASQAATLEQMVVRRSMGMGEYWQPLVYR